MRHLPTYQNTRTGAALAAAFGWSDEQLRAFKLVDESTRLDVSKAKISGEPAAMFGTVSARNGKDPVREAALYAYHASTPWGVVADDNGLTIINSQWLRESDWYRLPQITWDDTEANRSLLEAFTPSALIRGDTNRLTTRVQEPTDFLQPVDDALVERLDRWRDQAVKYASESARVDELLQTFYAQLFVLRTVEDRALDQRVPAASTAASSPDRFDRATWATITDLARQHIGSDLFQRDVTSAIPEHVLAGVVNDLYRPRKVPGSTARYNFAWIDSDVLGSAYEKYLASVLQPISAPAQIDLFLPPERGVERQSVRKSVGAYYTPKYITEYLSSRAVDDHFSRHNPDQPPAIIDFACGSGSFLVAAVDKVLTHLKRNNSEYRWARHLIDNHLIAGVDIDPRAVTAARLHLWQRLIEEPDALPLPNLSDVVIVANGLDTDTWGPLNKKYDIVLGNPPFLATSFVDAREKLENRFTTAQGRYDFSSLFVEQAVGVLQPGGQLGLVVPNRLFRNKSGAPVRRLLTQEMELRTIVDFGSTRPFDADAYVGCIIARRLAAGERPPPNAKLLVVEVRSLDADFLAAALLAASAGSPNVDGGLVRWFFARHPNGEAPWVLLSEADQVARIAIDDVSVRLDTIAAVPQGIRTGGNDLFVVSLISDDGLNLARVVNGLGEEFIIESKLLEYSVYGSQVRRYENILADTRLIYPYRNNHAISEPELERDFPHAWAYFSRNRDLLGARASLKKSGGRFYELVWPRDERWLRRPKLLIRDLAPSTAFAADPVGRIFLVGGTAVVPSEPQLLLVLLAYLNSSFVNELVRQMTPLFRGGYQKFEPQHIQSIPVLNRVFEDDNIAEQLTLLASTILESAELSDERRNLESQVDDLIYAAAEQSGVTVSRP